MKIIRLIAIAALVLVLSRLTYGAPYNAHPVVTDANTWTALNSFVLGLATGSSPPTCTVGTGGTWCAVEGTAPTGASGVDMLYADSTNHAIMEVPNAGAAQLVVIIQVPVSAPTPGQLFGLLENSSGLKEFAPVVNIGNCPAGQVATGLTANGPACVPYTLNTNISTVPTGNLACGIVGNTAVNTATGIMYTCTATGSATTSTWVQIAAAATPTATGTPTATPTPTTLTSTLTVSSSTTYNNYAISTTSGPCVIGTSVSSVVISNSKIGPCGTNTSADSAGVHFIGGNNNQVYDSYIFAGTLGTLTTENHAGIFFDGSTNGIAQGNVIAYEAVGIVADGSNGNGTANGMTAIGNFVLNNRSQGTSGSSFATGIQSVDTTSPTINGNYVLECVSTGNGEFCNSFITPTPTYYENMIDQISLFLTQSGLVENNYIVGGHACSSGPALATGDTITVDEGSNNNTLNNNVSIGSSGGQQLDSGFGNLMENSKSYQTQDMCSDVAFAVLNDYSGTYTCGPNTLSGNYGDNTANGHIGFYNSGSCGTVTQSGNVFGSGADATLAPISTQLPAPLIPPTPKNCTVKSPFTTQTSLPSC